MQQPSAATQQKYQEVAQLTVSKAKTAFPGLPVKEVKFVQVVTPAGVKPKQIIELTGAIEGKNITIKVPDGAEPGIQFEVPYVIFNLQAGHYVVGDPFIVDWEKRPVGTPAPSHPPNPSPGGVPMPDPMSKYPSEWRELGNKAFKKGNYDEAGALYTAGLERERRWQVEREKEGEADEADVEASMFGTMHLLFNNRAMALVKLGRPDHALADVDRALKLDPGFAKAHYQRGAILAGLGGARHLASASEALESADALQRQQAEAEAKAEGRAGDSAGGEQPPKQTAAAKLLMKVRGRIQVLEEKEKAKQAKQDAAKQEQVEKMKEYVAQKQPKGGSAAAQAGAAAPSPLTPTPMMVDGQPVQVPLNGAAMNAPGRPAWGGCGLDRRVHPTDYTWGPIPPRFLAQMSEADRNFHAQQVRAHGAGDSGGGGGGGGGEGRDLSGVGTDGAATARAETTMVAQQRHNHYRLPSRVTDAEEVKAGTKKSAGPNLEKLTTKAAKMGDGWLSAADKEAKWVDITEYSFSEEEYGNKVHIYVEMEDIQLLPPGRVTANFSDQSMMLKVRGLRNREYPEAVNLRLWCEELWGPIDSAKCALAIRKDKLTVTLVKGLGSDKPWERLQYGRGGAWMK